MTTVQFLAEWAVRSSILILAGALFLRLLRVKDPSIRLAAWTAILCGSLALPAVTLAAPRLQLVLMQAAAPVSKPPVISHEVVSVHEQFRQAPVAASRFDWSIVAAAIYALVAGALLLRAGIGLLMSRSLRRTSRATGLVAEGVEVRESDRVAAPVTVGIVRSTILLPADWPEWGREKLDAVLAHERSHVGRRDPAVQLLSTVHRALLWHSPLSWVLHRRVVRLAEDASDDAAVVVTRDRATYAEVLLDFMQRGAHGARGHGVAMARYGRPDERIDRILDSKAVSTGVTRWAVAAIVVLATPLAYVTAATQPSRARQTRTVATVPAAGAVSGASAGPAASTFVAAPQAPTLPNRPASPATEDSGRIRRYMIFLDDSTSGSWDSRDPVEEDALRRRFGRRFAWFRHAGHEYVVTDAGVLRELEQAMEPQRNVNRMQSDVNGRQSKVNELQAKVNAQQDEVNRLQRDANLRQNDVNALQTEVNRRQDMMNGIQAAAGSEKKEMLIRKLEAAINQLRAAAGEGDQESANRRQSEVNAAQSRVNEAQAKVNEAQSRVNQEQGLVNEAQQKVNEEQRRVSAQYNARMREIFDTVLQPGLAQRLN